MTDRQVEPLGKVRTKIVATIGPATREPEVLKPLIAGGVDLARLNFSHGTHDEQTAALEAVRAAAASSGRVVGVLMDLGGPKIRLGPIAGGEVDCQIGQEFAIIDSETSNHPQELTCTYRQLAADLKPGDPVLFADGAVAMEVTATALGRAELKVTLAGRIRSRQGINLPGTDLKLASLTEKDLLDLDWAAAHQVDYIALSFVRSVTDVNRLREEMIARKIDAGIVAKIEKPQAVDDLEAIVAASDAVMVARGDLGVEMDVALVPAIQKRLITACRRAGRPVITATQMLASMEQSSRPTRAEAADDFNAVLDGTDAVMLSGETAVGRYPVEAVGTMSRIVAEAERLLPSGRPDVGPSIRTGWVSAITESVVEAASLACRRLNAALLVVATHSGRTALALSQQGHATPTLALTDDLRIARRMALYWGVTPLFVASITDLDHALSFALDFARSHALVTSGDRVVLVRGTVSADAAHNAMLVLEVD